MSDKSNDLFLDSDNTLDKDISITLNLNSKYFINKCLVELNINTLVSR